MDVHGQCGSHRQYDRRMAPTRAATLNTPSMAAAEPGWFFLINRP